MKITYKQHHIYFEVSGAGRPLVLLHGFLENHHVWEAFIPKLAAHHKVISIDLFGHGESEKVGYVHTMEQMAEAVSLILKKLTIKQASFVGHSMGGYVALAFTELFPEQVAQLILLNSTPEADSPERQENRDRAKRLLKLNKKTFVHMAIKNLFTDETRKKFKKEIDQLITEAEKIPAENAIATVEGLKQRKDRTDILTNYRRKKTIISGKNDTVIAFARIQEIAKQTQTPLVVFPDGHMTFIEHQQKLLNKLLELLR